LRGFFIATHFAKPRACDLSEGLDFRPDRHDFAVN
jgi:hypothetical protein